LAILGIITAALNPTRTEDIGQAVRLLLFALYTMSAIHWTRTRAANFVLRAFLTGLAVGGALNVYVTYAHPYLRVAFLPVLYARNGTGGPLSLAVGLGALLFLIRKTRVDATTAVLVSLVGVFAAVISFSKTSMVTGVFGVGAWMFVLGTGVTLRGRITTIALLTAAVVYVGQATQLADFLSSFQYSLGIKFASAALSLNDQASTQWRYQYFWGVSEIVAKHPLTGVGPSGFYDAIIATRPFQNGLMGEEDPAARVQGGANPHNSFLFIAASNGIPGLLIGLSLFIGFWAILRRRLKPYGLAGAGVCACVTLGYFILGMTLPNLFNTMILYLPAGVAIGLGNRPRLPARFRSPFPTRLAAATGGVS
jgi:O-antigen ligase